MTLLDRVSREAEASLKSSGASFLGSVMLQEKKASIKDFKMLKVCWMCDASTGMVVVDINIVTDVLLYQCKGICVYGCASSCVLSMLSIMSFHDLSSILCCTGRSLLFCRVHRIMSPHLMAMLNMMLR